MSGKARRPTRIVCQIVLMALLVQALVPAIRPTPAGAVTSVSEPMQTVESAPAPGRPSETQQDQPASQGAGSQPHEQPADEAAAKPEEGQLPRWPLEAELAASTMTVRIGDVVTLTLTLTNTSPVAVPSFFLGAHLPEGLSLQSGPFSFDYQYRIAWMRHPALAPGAARQIVFSALVDEMASRRLIVSATPWHFRLQPRRPARVDLYVQDGAAGGISDFDPETEGGWRPTFDEPVVATFSGAASYSYPIELPPGRNGLQPSISLSYNSKGVDGLLNWEGSEWVGLGWNIDAVDIVRTNVRYIWPGNYDWITYDNDFRLSINGTSYWLVPADENQNHGRYYADGMPEIYVERINDCTDDGNCYNNTGGSRSNRTTEYWIVRTADGTTYRLGYEAISEQVLYRTGNCDPDCSEAGSPYSGPVANYSAFRWRVDHVSDAYGNAITYEYVECRTGSGQSPPACAKYTDGPFGQRELSSYLSVVRYNQQGAGWLTEIEFVGQDKNLRIPVNEPPILRMRRQLDSIRVKWDGTIVREYVMTYDERGTPSAGVILLLTGITPYGLGGQAGGNALPGPVFAYQQFANKGWCVYNPPGGCVTEWDQEQFPYERLVSVENGYGGRVEFQYEHDGRDNWWEGYKGYRVAARTIHDGLSSGAVRKDEFDYGIPCYDQWDDRNGQVVLCTRPNNPDYLGPLVGHDSVTVTVSISESAAFQPVQTVNHRFHINSSSEYLLRGREYRSETYDGGLAVLLEERVFTYGLNDAVCRSDGLGAAGFVCLKQTETIIHDGADADSVTTRVTYAYNPDYQGGTQYGQTTHVTQYVNEQAHRTTRRWHSVRDDGDHFLIRLMSEGIYEGIGWNEVASTWYYYDDNDQHTDPLGEWGALTRIQRVQTDYVAGDYRHIKTADAVYGYDQTYGNVITETQFTDYGLMTQLQVEPYSLTWDWYPAVAQTTRTTYDEDGLRPVEVRNPLNMSVTMTYDVNLPWLVEGVTDPNGATTSYRYDDLGRLSKVFRPGDSLNEPPSRMILYDDQWSPLMITVLDKTDPEAPNLWGDGVMWQRSFYDGLGRLIQTQRPAEDWADSPAPAGHDILQTYAYDGRGLQIWASVPYTVERYVYDGQNPASPYQEPPVGVVGSQTIYDALGRAIRLTSPDPAIATEHLYGVEDGYTYDAVIDPNGHRVQYWYNGLGQLDRVDEFEGDGETVPWAVYAQTRYDYDVMGNLVAVTDDHENLTEITYDALGRKVEMDDPDMGVWTYQYDAAGNLITQTDALLNEIGFDYDALNRLTAKRHGGETLASYSYDEGDWGIGRRTGMADGSGSTAWAYDGRGRLEGEAKTIEGIGTYTTTYTYDAADRVATMTYPDGETVTSGYNPQGLAENLAGSASYVTGAGYNPMGQLTWLGLGNGVDVTYQYFLPEEGNGRLESVLAIKGAYKHLDLSYTYDDAGNVEQITDRTSSLEWEDFGYDSLDRLVSAERYFGVPPQPIYQREYEYSEIGNIITRTVSGVEQSYGYDSSDHVHAVTFVSDGSAFVYDGNGNMTWREGAGKGYQQVFDAENRLVMVTSSGSGLKGWDTVIGEVGFINDSLTDQEQTINLANSYRNPVVIAQPISRDSSDAAVARITEVTRDSFTLYVQEAPGLPPGHTTEAVSYLVLEAGAYELEDGTRLEVGTVETDATVGMGVSNRWEGVSFVSSFGATPVILSQVQTERDAHWVKTRQNSASADGFQVALEEEEAKTTAHGVERIGWLAIESGKSGTVSGHAYKTGLTPDSVTHSWYQISFGGFTAAPRFLAMLQSYDDPDNCHLRYGRTTLRASGVQVMIEEDKTQDPYTSHGTEVVGYVAIQGSGSLEGRPVGMTRFVYDGDGNRVLQVEPDGSRRAFVGAHYEVWRPGPPPPAPEDLYAVYHDWGGESYVGLGWKPTTAEEGSTFSVYRSATTPVPLDAGHRIASGLTSGSYPDFNGQLGDYYVVTAVNQYGDSGPSNTAQAQKVGITGGEEDAGSIVAGGGQAPNDGERSAVGGTEVLSGEEILKYYFLGGRRVAMRRDGVVYYFHTDHLGSTSAMSDGAGNAYGDPVRYLPFGEVRSGDLDALATDHGFTGHKHNTYINLVDMKARWYSAEIGRFVQPDTIIPDPLNPQSFNRYAYVLNNPAKYRDPDGHFAWIPLGLLGGAIGGAVYGYGAQVVANLNGGMNLGQALTTNIDPTEVGFYTAVGAALGTGMGAAALGVEAAVTTIGIGQATTAAGTATTVACADGNCHNEAQAVERMVIETDWTVLGKFPGYLERAAQWGANALNIPADVWNRLATDADRWAKNAEFLDDCIAKGHSFVLSVPFEQGWRETGTFFKQELIYLLEKGYELVNINGVDFLVKP